MAALTRTLGEVAEHTTNLAIGGFFFAMRACEFVRTKRKGRTKIIMVGDVSFRDKDKRRIPHEHKDATLKARYIAILFRDQKNGRKMDRRTQSQSGDPVLCPIRAWADIISKVRASGGNDETPVCTLHRSDRKLEVSDENLKRMIRFTCKSLRHRFPDLKPSELGTRSIRSGAAMSLFLMDHSVEKIKILGRWSSDAFLVYIRPQVLEWTNLMARDMVASHEHTDPPKRAPNQTRSTAWANPGMMPRFYIGS